jgi:hypothetical protein
MSRAAGEIASTPSDVQTRSRASAIHSFFIKKICGALAEFEVANLLHNEPFGHLSLQAAA